MGTSVATRPLGNLLAVLCCLLSGWAVWGTGTERQAFQVPPEHLPISRMAVHPQSGHVYVGANNYVARLSPDLRLMDSAQLGNDSSENVTSGSWQVRTMEIFPDLERLLVCWQESSCMCRTLSLHNISVMEDTRMENLTCNEHSVAVISPKKEDGTNGTGNMLLAAPWLQTAPVLSFLTLKVSVASVESSFLFANTTGVSHVYGQTKHSFNISFVHGFVYQDFIYLVTVQEDQLLSHRLVSKISQVCHNCSSVMPYVEVRLYCPHNSKNYSIATAARLARIPNGDRSEDVLIVSFVDSHEALRNPTTGSVVCVHPMGNIQRAMKGTLQGLFTNTQAKWLSINHTQDNLIEVCKGLNTARSGGEDATIVLDMVLHLSGLVTSIQSVHLQNTSSVDQREVLLLTTSLGQLLQYDVTTKTYSKPWELNRSYNLTSTSIPWIDSGIHEDNIYVSTNDTVYQENWALFPEYQDCEACVTNSPTRQWCEGGCYLRGYHTCERSMQERTCPPEISQIKPTGGLKSGGTELTILGKRLGTSPGKVEVKVCSEKCALLSVNLTKVVCRTPAAQPDRLQCGVSIRVDETNSNISKVNIRGNATALQNFTYQDPVLTILKPHRGPRSGGTELTITSTGLRPGDDITVFLGQALCVDARATETEITCTTSPLDTDEDGEPPVSVNVTLAVGGLNFTGNTTFKYEEDPQITNVEPRRSITSGGLNITVEGKNLDVIARPRIGLKTPGASLEDANATELCTVNNGAVSMTCPSPEARGVAQDGKAEIYFLMDGVESLRNFSAFHPELAVMEVLPDPTVPPSSSESPKTVDPRRDPRLKLEISGLKGVVPENQVSVTVGQSVCKDLEISDTHVSCDLQAWRETNAENESRTTFDVVIKIGRLEIGLGKVQLTQEPKTPLQNGHLKIIVGASAGVGGFLLVVVVLCCCCWWCRRKSHSHKCNHEVYSMASSNTEMVAFKSRTGIVDPAKIKLVEKSNLLIKKDHLQLGDCVGEGNFGCVYVGHLTKQGSQVKVAVKTLRDEDSQSVNLNDFVDEALRMKDFDDPNVLNLLGIAFGESSLPMVVLPFMERGDLHSYIANWQNEVTVVDVIKFGRDIASGMAYLSKRKFVHRDLAARNCMLESDLRVRVADFGLGRDIYEKGYYHSDNKKKLPIRWMSIESIEGGTYSTKSDVWSLGVVLWELFTRGVTPYPGVDGWDIARFLRAGRRLDQPWFCPTDVYELMLSCWMEEPSSRPGFLDIRERLDQIYAIHESNTNQAGGIYVTLGECARYQNVQNVADGAYFVLENPSQPSSPGSHAPSSPTGYTPLQVSSMANLQGDHPYLISAAPAPSYFPDPPPPSAAPLPGGEPSVYANERNTACSLPPPPADLLPPAFPDPPPPSAIPLAGGEPSVYANEKNTACSLPPPPTDPLLPAFPDPPPFAFPNQPPLSQPDPPSPVEATCYNQPSTLYIPGLKTTPSSPPPTTQAFVFPAAQLTSRPARQLSTFSTPKPPPSQT